VQARVPGDLEGSPELGARHLLAAEAQADQPGRPVTQHQLDGLEGKLGPAATVDVSAPAQPHAVLGLGLGATLLDPLEQRLGRHAAQDMAHRGHRDLRVADVLRRQRRAQLPGDQRKVLRASEVPADEQIDLEEMREVAEAVQREQALLAAGQHAVRLGPGELQQGRQRDRPLQVHVQLHLWHGVDEPGESIGERFDTL